jgi:hypothetical protein
MWWGTPAHSDWRAHHAHHVPIQRAETQALPGWKGVRLWMHAHRPRLSSAVRLRIAPLFY